MVEPALTVTVGPVASVRAALVALVAFASGTRQALSGRPGGRSVQQPARECCSSGRASASGFGARRWSGLLGEVVQLGMIWWSRP
jgi:hypothetical protein